MAEDGLLVSQFLRGQSCLPALQDCGHDWAVPGKTSYPQAFCKVIAINAARNMPNFLDPKAPLITDIPNAWNSTIWPIDILTR